MKYTDFPLKQSKYATAIVRKVRENATASAARIRQTVSPRHIIQHSETELCTLYEIAASLHDDELLVGYTLQCGTFCGGSACVMAHALKDANSDFTPILTIDSYTKEFEPLREAFNNAYIECRENIWANNLTEHVHLVLADDVQYLKHFWNSPIRLAFIDSSHHYQHTKDEISLITPHLINRGWLIFDDYFNENTPGVQKAILEFLDHTSMNFEIYRVNGLLIFRKNNEDRG